MKICTVGFGHFAEVVSSCLWQKGHEIATYDERPFLIREGQPRGQDEPGWQQPTRVCATALGKSSFWDSAEVDLFWIAYDVPLDASGAPVVDEILARIKRLHDAVPKSIPFLVSCQWPVGTTRKIASQCEGREFVYVMENVRVGKAIADFQANPFPAIGRGRTRQISHAAYDLFMAIIGRFPLFDMSWESAEFAKHSMNAFLALQIAFVNELARIAPADVNMADVTRVLKSDPRVSPLAPLSAGGPFGGGSLKRDVRVLYELTPDTYTPIIGAILPSNEWTPDAEEARAERKAKRAK